MFAKRDLWIDADVRRVREAREWAASAARELGFRHDDCCEVKLAVGEVVANAIQHGSSARDDRIRLSVCSDDGALVFEVLDTGVFARAEEAAGEIAERGRGLEVVEILMDELELGPGAAGTLVRFKKRPSLNGAGRV